MNDVSQQSVQSCSLFNLRFFSFPIAYPIVEIILSLAKIETFGEEILHDKLVNCFCPLYCLFQYICGNIASVINSSLSLFLLLPCLILEKKQRKNLSTVELPYNTPFAITDLFQIPVFRPSMYFP